MAESTPTLTVGLATFGSPPGGADRGPTDRPTWRNLLEWAAALERAGVTRIVVPDHVVNGPNLDAYPFGTFPTGPEADWLEPLTVLAAIAGATRTIRLCTGILVAPLRPAVVLAKTVATLDVLSDGRVDLGVGTGWQPEEFRAAGVDFHQRGNALTDTIAACRALWRGGPTTFHSDTVTLDEVYCAPVPAQERLPVWFSGTLNARNLRRIVDLGDGWIPRPGTGGDELAAGARVLRDAFDAAGRDTRAVRVRASAKVATTNGGVDLHATAAGFGDLLDAGATDLHVQLRGLVAGDADTAAVERAGAELMRALHLAVGR